MQAVLCLLNIIVYFWLPHPLFLNIIEKLDNIEYRYYTQSRNIDTRYLLWEIVMKAGSNLVICQEVIKKRFQ